MPALVGVADEDKDDDVVLEISCESCGRLLVWILGDEYPECPTCDRPTDEDAA